MGKQGINITKEQTHCIIELYKQGCNIEEIIQETGLSDAEIKKVIANNANGHYDSKFIYRGKTVKTQDGNINVLNPLIRYK